MTRTDSFWTEIIRGDDVHEVEIEYTCSPYIAATYWQPAEGGEIEILSALLDGEPFILTDAEEAKIMDDAAQRDTGDY